MTIWLVLLAIVLIALLLRGFRKWISSMAGAVSILAVVAALTLSGVLIGQNLPREAYLDRYGDAVGTFILRSGLSEVFSSWYFILLVSVLGVSLIACSFGRLRGLATVRARRRPRRVGSLILHLSLVVVLAGAVVTAIFGYRYPGTVYLGAGDTMDIPEGGFSLRVDAASTEFAENGMVSEYFSDVTVIDDGQEVMTRRIEVNHPLIYGGVGVYQHEMLPSPTSLEEVVLGISMRTKDGDGPLRHLVLPYNDDFTIPGTDVSLKVLEFLSDFTYDIERRTAVLASVRHRNPAVLVQVSEAGSVLADRWVFADVQTHRSDEGLPCRIYLLDYVPDFEHGLTRFEISHQPGTPLIYAGFAAMSLGLILAFWTGAGSAGRDNPEVDADGGRR
ncbi:MAG: cytochrome c biogenesis protein ResB [Candidatus Eisenbacteria bacterium]|nr:cytochrome c biogenesis protein ResB [Candidatus Eisenbacteria bacterium]